MESKCPFRRGFWAAIAWSIPVVPDQRSPRRPAKIVSRRRIWTAARCLLASSRCQNDRCTNCITVLMLNVQSLQKSCVASFREGEFWKFRNGDRTNSVRELSGCPTYPRSPRKPKVNDSSINVWKCLWFVMLPLVGIQRRLWAHPRTTQDNFSSLQVSWTVLPRSLGGFEGGNIPGKP